MEVIYKPVGSPPFKMDIDKSLEQFQSMVGGYFEYVMVFQDVAIVCNEEGRLNGMPLNCKILGQYFYGPIFFVGVGRNDWKSCKLSVEEVSKMLEVIP